MLLSNEDYESVLTLQNALRQGNCQSPGNAPKDAVTTYFRVLAFTKQCLPALIRGIMSFSVLLLPFLTGCAGLRAPAEFAQTQDYSILPADLPIPREQIFYSDLADNRQIQRITPMIDYVQYPTLGCPALLDPSQRLQVLLSLPVDVEATGVTFSLVDRHQQDGMTIELRFKDDPEELITNPDVKRKLVRFWLEMDNIPFALLDLQVAFDNKKEVQYNAVRRYEAITGTEKVVICGDTQYHVDNQVCLEKFIERVNPRDIAWIAIIGDVCDNGCKGIKNVVKLAADAKSEPVTHYYDREYKQSHELLRTLRHPVLLVPGNHDGMSAYPTYDEGNPSDTYLGPDHRNATEYDGLHHFRRTFGPLFFRFDWGQTRYICTNTFELTRNQRLGYHAVVANWGGWMREEQMKWVKRELENGKGKRKVLLMHHDPRGGSRGVRLGCYHRMRSYRFDRKWPTLKSYAPYLLKHGLRTWQQEWMAPIDSALSDHPVQNLLRDMLEHKVWAVIMGHDNENWIDSYSKGRDLFQTNPTTNRYITPPEIKDDDLVDDIIDYLENADYEALSNLLDTKSEDEGEALLSAALDEISRAETRTKIAFAPDPAKQWGLEVKSAIHFVHVDHVGGYKYSKSSHFDDYGYVVATLERGAPAWIQSHRTSGESGKLEYLGAD